MKVKRLAGLLVVVALVAVLIIPGCGGGGAVTSPTPPPDGEHEELTLIGATYVPPVYDIYSSIGGFADYVNENGKGIVQIDWYHSGTLLDAKNIMPGLFAGTADLVNMTDSYIVGSYPIIGVRCLPFLFPDPEISYQICKPGSPLSKLVNEQLAKQNLFEIAYGGALSENIFTVDRLVKSPSDMKGLKIRAAGLVESKVAAALGAAPTTIPSAEAYLALQRGTVSGIMCYPGTVDARALYEVVHYNTIAPFASYGASFIVPLDRWNSWPKDVQDILLKAGEGYAYKIMHDFMKLCETSYWPVWKDKYGMTITELTPEEFATFKEATAPVYDWWVGEVGTEVGNEALRLAEAK